MTTFRPNTWYRLKHKQTGIELNSVCSLAWGAVDFFVFDEEAGAYHLPLDEVVVSYDAEEIELLTKKDHDKLRLDFQKLGVASSGLLEQLRQYTQDATSEVIAVRNIVNRQSAVISDNGMVVND